MAENQFGDSNHPGESSERNYSAEVAAALRAARAELARANASQATLEATFSTLVQLARKPMARSQLLQTCQLAASAATQAGEHELALRWNTRAHDLALQVEDIAALIQLHLQRATIFRATSKLSNASEECALSIAHIRDQYQLAQTAVDRAGEARILVQRAGYEYMRALPQLATQLLDEATALFRATTATPLDIAPIEWIYAHIAHDRGQLGEALIHAIEAASIFSASGAQSSASRIASLVAEILLDLAEAQSNPASEACQQYLHTAGTYIRRAIKLAPLAADPGGHGLALLQRARYDRLRGHGERAPATIESVIHSARVHEDLALLAQARTSQARLFELRGETAQALKLYSESLDLVSGGDFTVLGFKAQRAILHASEMGTDIFS